MVKSPKQLITHSILNIRRSRICHGNEVQMLRQESVLLTHIALAGEPLTQRTYVEIQYTDSSGQHCVCHCGALIADTVGDQSSCSYVAIR